MERRPFKIYLTTVPLGTLQGSEVGLLPLPWVTRLQVSQYAPTFALCRRETLCEGFRYSYFECSERTDNTVLGLFMLSFS